MWINDYDNGDCSSDPNHTTYIGHTQGDFGRCAYLPDSTDYYFMITEIDELPSHDHRVVEWEESFDEIDWQRWNLCSLANLIQLIAIY